MSECYVVVQTNVWLVQDPHEENRKILVDIYSDDLDWGPWDPKPPRTPSTPPRDDVWQEDDSNSHICSYVSLEKVMGITRCDSSRTTSTETKTSNPVIVKEVARDHNPLKDHDYLPSQESLKYVALKETMDIIEQLREKGPTTTRRRIRPPNSAAVTKSRRKKAALMRNLHDIIDRQRREADSIKKEIMKLSDHVSFRDPVLEKVPEECQDKKFQPRYKSPKYQNDDLRKEARKKCNRETNHRSRERLKIISKNLNEEHDFWMKEIPELKRLLNILKKPKRMTSQAKKPVSSSLTQGISGDEESFNDSGICDSNDESPIDLLL